MTSDLIESVACPECDQEVEVGLPRSSTVEAVTGAPDQELEEGFLEEGARYRRCRNRCSDGHELFIYFER